MLSHPPRVRSAGHAALSDEKQVRKKFLQIVFIRDDFCIRPRCSAAPEYDHRKLKDVLRLRKINVSMRTLPRKTAPPERAHPIAAKRKARLSAGLRRTLPICKNLERAKGFEPSTPTLARSCSTTELHPHPRDWRRSLASNGQSYAKSPP